VPPSGNGDTWNVLVTLHAAMAVAPVPMMTKNCASPARKHVGTAVAVAPAPAQRSSIFPAKPPFAFRATSSDG